MYKNSESFYILKDYINNKGTSTSVIARKLVNLTDLLKNHGPTRNDVMVWAKKEAKLETLKYKEERKRKAIQITFHTDRQLDFDKQKFFMLVIFFCNPFTMILFNCQTPGVIRKKQLTYYVS